MYDKFGEFASVEELNRAAAAQKAEGDEEALIALAEENGIDKDDALDYMDDCVEELATPLMAALGKLKVEKEDLKLEGILKDWAEEIEAMCTENIGLCRAVREKGKDLAGYLAMTAEAGFKNAATVDPKIVQRTSRQIRNIVGNHPLKIGVPDKLTRRYLIREYYLGKEGA